MRITHFIAPLTAVALLMFGGVAHADLLIAVDKSTQRMTVTVNGEGRTGEGPGKYREGHLHFG